MYQYDWGSNKRALGHRDKPTNTENFNCYLGKSLMAQCKIERLRGLKCTGHDLVVMGSNPSWIEHGVRGISV